MSIRLFLCGDAMTGRGIDQALPHPVSPVLYEPYVRDAREYVDLAEKANGPIRRPVTFDYIWGDVLQELERAEVNLRIINLETAITSAETPWRGKGIHYRMHPRNIGCLSAARIANQMREFQQPCDLLVASIHWGSNWGYDIPPQQIAFAHRLVEGGVAIVHGHSSHHVKAIEVFKGRLILYGCGDFITDYEGISGYESFRGHLALMYLVDLDSRSGELLSVRLVPMQMRRFRLEQTSAADARWLCNLLEQLGESFGISAEPDGDNSLILEW